MTSQWDAVRRPRFTNFRRVLPVRIDDDDSSADEYERMTSTAFDHQRGEARPGELPPVEYGMRRFEGTGRFAGRFYDVEEEDWQKSVDEYRAAGGGDLEHSLNVREVVNAPVQTSSTAGAPAKEAKEAKTPAASKARNLRKKIRDIENLERRLDEGAKLEHNQLQKIKAKAAVQAELAALLRHGVRHN